MPAPRDHRRNTLLSLADWADGHEAPPGRETAPHPDPGAHDAPSLAELLRRRGDTAGPAPAAAPTGRAASAISARRRFLTRIGGLLRRRAAARVPQTPAPPAPAPDAELAAEIEAVRARVRAFAAHIVALSSTRRAG